MRHSAGLQKNTCLLATGRLAAAVQLSLYKTSKLPAAESVCHRQAQSVLRSLTCDSSSCSRVSVQAEAPQCMGQAAARWAAHEPHACVCQSHLLLGCFANEDVAAVQTIC